MSEKELSLALIKRRYTAAQLLKNRSYKCAIYCIYDAKENVYRFSDPPKMMSYDRMQDRVNTKDYLTVYCVRK